MKGMLKGKKPGTQFLILISITLGCFFILGLLFTVALAQISGIGLATLSDPDKWDTNDPKIMMVVRGMMLVQFFCLCVIPSVICAKMFSTDSKKYLGLVRPYHNLYYLIGGVILLLAIPLTGFLGELNQRVEFPAGIANWMKEQEESAAKTLKMVLSKHTIKDLLLNLFFIAGLAAVGEELLFRGVAQRILIRWFKSPWAGIIIAAFLFSAMHVQFYGFVPRFLLGIILGAIYWYSGSLWIAILGHFVYDAVLIVMVYNDPSMLNDNTTGMLKSIWAPALISAVAVAAALTWMKKNSDSRYPEIYADDAVPVKNHPF